MATMRDYFILFLVGFYFVVAFHSRANPNIQEVDQAVTPIVDGNICKK